MNQERHSNQKFHRLLSHRALISGGLSCLSGLSVFSTGVAIAQTPTSADSSALSNAEVPAAQDLLLPPASEAPAPAIEDPIVIPEAAPAPAPADLAPAPEPAASSAPAAPPSSAADAPLVAPDLAERAKTDLSGNLGGNLGGNQPYIDSTPYNIGATRYEAPGSIVLSERSSGCQAVLANGQSATSICQQVAPEVAASMGGGVASNPGGGGLGAVAYDVYNFVTGGGGGRTTPSGRDYYSVTARPPARLGNGNVAMLFPLSIPSVITSAFGWRLHPVMGYSRFHSGTDLGADEGTPVLAAFSGKVAIADFMGGYGLTVVLRHGNSDSEETLYGHLSEIFVKPGEAVKQGEVIGRVGSTGMSTGPHLHFEFRQKTNDSWVAIDPGLALENSLNQFLTALKTGKRTTVAAAPIDPLQRLKEILKETKARKGETKNEVTAQVLPKPPQTSGIPGLQ